MAFWLSKRAFSRPQIFCNVYDLLGIIGKEQIDEGCGDEIIDDNLLVSGGSFEENRFTGRGGHIPWNRWRSRTIFHRQTHGGQGCF